MKTPDLGHGGIMANYRCNAACRHCLYACSPRRGGGYITAENARKACALLAEAGCRSLHIGGGEPFLDFDGLLGLVREIKRAGISLSFIETNAFWAASEDRVKARLDALAAAGVDALCISLDPFHAEFVPVGRPLFLAEMCGRAGMGCFLWQEKFARVLSRLDPKKVHSRQELEKIISPNYVVETAQGYGLHYGGRAVQIEEEFAARKPVSKLAAPCRGLLSGGHFHVDMFARFIPPGCTGIAIPLEEAVRGVPEKKYPVFELLARGDVPGLLEYAKGFGFAPDPAGYASTCALCFHLRRWLSENIPHAELDAEHYAASLAKI